jgi:sRNA-binding carbon storage regulator CsrA
MDLLNHRSDQQLVLPNLDVSIQVLHVEGETVTVGSSAPSDIPFSQQQIDDDQHNTRAGISREHVTEAHDSSVHKRLIDVRISAGLLRRQLGQGSLEEAGDTVETLMEQLLQLDQEITSRFLASVEDPPPIELFAENADESGSLLSV